MNNLARLYKKLQTIYSPLEIIPYSTSKSGPPMYIQNFNQILISQIVQSKLLV